MIPRRRAEDSITVTIKLGKLALPGIVMSRIITTPTRERSARLMAVITVAFVLYSVKYDMTRITRDIFTVRNRNYNELVEKKIQGVKFIRLFY